MDKKQLEENATASQDYFDQLDKGPLIFQRNIEQLNNFEDASQGAFDQLAGGLDTYKKAIQTAKESTETYLNTVMRPLTEEFIFQKLAVGLEGQALIDFAIKMGRVDSAAAAAYGQLDLLNSQFDAGAKKTDYYAQQSMKLKAAIDNLQNKTVVIEYLERYTRENAPGGSGGYVPPSAYGPPSLPQPAAPAAPPYNPYENNSMYSPDSMRTVAANQRIDERSMARAIRDALLQVMG